MNKRVSLESKTNICLDDKTINTNVKSFSLSSKKHLFLVHKTNEKQINTKKRLATESIISNNRKPALKIPQKFHTLLSSSFPNNLFTVRWYKICFDDVSVISQMLLNIYLFLRASKYQVFLSFGRVSAWSNSTATYKQWTRFTIQCVPKNIEHFEYLLLISCRDTLMYSESMMLLLRTHCI